MANYSVAHVNGAITGNARPNAEAITVVVAGDKVTLSGTVRTWDERRRADLAAWSSPHVDDVYNHIVVKA